MPLQKPQGDRSTRLSKCFAIQSCVGYNRLILDINMESTVLINGLRFQSKHYF